MAYFFLSYARGDDDAWVDKFYRELCEDFRRRTGAPAEAEVGFLDTRSVDIGALWSVELQQALATCQVFLAVYSPRYFARPTCGKEWAVFAARIRAYEARTGSRPNAIIPILWVPQHDLPPVAAAIQYRNEELGATYARKGLYGIIRVRRFEDDYQEFLGELTTKIIEIMRSYPLPSGDPVSLDAVASAFPEQWIPWQVDQTRPTTPADPAAPPAVAAASSSAATGPATAAPALLGATPLMTAPPHPVPVSRPSAGPVDSLSRPMNASGGRPAPVGSSRHVHFVLVATSRDGLPAERGRKDFYGDDPAEWRPYLSESTDPLLLLAQRGALNQKFTSNLATVDDGILDWLDWAREHNQIVVLLVDVWAAYLERYRRLLRQYDERNEPTSGVMVPWSDADEETQSRSDTLKDHLHAAFPNNVIRRDSVFRSCVRTADKFDRELTELLTVAQNRVFSKGRIHKVAQGAAPTRLPILDGP